MVRTAFVFRIHPGREADYSAWLTSSAEKLAGVYTRNGVHVFTVLIAGRRVITHFESEEKDSVARAFADPESVALREKELAGVLDLEEGETPVLHEEIFAWSASTTNRPIERAGLLLTIQKGQEAAYREWLASGVLEELERIWSRNDIYQHGVLAAGTSLIAYYECRSRYNVLKAFREPEALAMLIGQLSAILELEPHTPVSLFEEALTWRKTT